MEPVHRTPVRRRWLFVSALALGAVGLVGGTAIAAGLARSDEPPPPHDELLAGPRETTTAAPTSSTTTVAPTTVSPTTVTPSTTVPPTTTAPEVDQRCAIDDLSLRQQSAQLVMVGVDPTGRSGLEQLLASPEPVGGVFIGGDSDGIFAGDALRATIGGRPLMVAVDDEGGRVQRLDGLHGPMPSAREQAASMTPVQVREMARARGRQLAAVGVNVNFAPVVDVASTTATGVIGDRSYGEDPAQVIEYAAAFAAGMDDAGVLPTLKHFPGHGQAVGDSHRGVVASPTLDSLERHDLVPYAELLGDSRYAVMVGHLDVPGLTEAGVPTSLSPATYRYLRSTTGFGGLVVTDELGGMEAVSSRFGAGEAAVRAIAAGADVALFADSAVVTQVVDALELAVQSGRIDPSRLGDALRRVRVAQGCPDV